MTMVMSPSLTTGAGLSSKEEEKRDDDVDDDKWANKGEQEEQEQKTQNIDISIYSHLDWFCLYWVPNNSFYQETTTDWCYRYPDAHT